MDCQLVSRRRSLTLRSLRCTSLLATILAALAMVDAGTVHAQATAPIGAPPVGAGTQAQAPMPAPYQSAAPAYPAAPMAPGYSPNAARAQMLLSERQKWERPASLATPISLLAVGAGLTLAGWAVVYPLSSTSCGYPYDYYGSCSNSSWNAGMVIGALTGTAGIVLSVVGVSMLPGRIIRRHRRGRELNRIDAELRSLGVQASLTPFVSSGRAGMNATLRF